MRAVDIEGCSEQHRPRRVWCLMDQGRMGWIDYSRLPLLIPGSVAEEMGNARFWRGSAYVSIDTYGLSVDGRHTFDVYVDGDYDRPPACDEEWSG